MMLLSKFKATILLCILLFPLTARAEDVSMRLKVDKTKLQLGDTLQLQLTVKGTQSAPHPKIPKTNAFNLQYLGQSSQYQIINGASSSSVVFTYTVFPLKEGTFEIGPVNVIHKGRKITANPVTIQVLPANAKVQKPQEIILRTLVSTTTPYYNQQILFTLQFARRADVTNARLEMPSFDDFWVEDLEEQREANRVIDGHTYLVTEVRKALFPNKTGTIIIDPAAIQCEVFLPENRRQSRDPFSSFFRGFRRRTKRKHLQSQPIKLQVKPLPEKGKPANFYPLVGNIELTSGLSKRKLEAGDSTTLTITVSGNANIRDAGLVEPEEIPEFKIYDDKPQVEIIPQESGVLGKKIFKKALVPLNAGSPKIPVYEIPYFNPETKRYEIAQTSPLALTVRASAEKEKLHALGSSSGAVPKKAIKMLGKDILSVYTHPNALENEQFSSAESTTYSLLFILSPGIFIGLLSSRKRSQLYQKNIAVRRRKLALKSAHQKIQKISATGDTNEAYAQTAKIIKEYLGDKLTLPGGALTPQEIETKLHAAGVSRETIDQLNDLMRECEFCQFASSQGQKDCSQIIQQSKELLTKLEKHF